MQVPDNLDTFITKLDAALEFAEDGQPIPYDIATKGILLNDKPPNFEPLTKELLDFFQIGATFRLNDKKYFQFELKAAQVTPEYVIFHTDLDNPWAPTVIHLSSISICRFYREGLFELINKTEEKL